MHPLLLVTLVLTALLPALALARSLLATEVEPGTPWLVVSERGQAQGASPEPLVLFGEVARAEIAGLIARQSTLSVLCAPDLTRLEAWLEEHGAAAIVALSPAGRPGEAAQAIAAFRETQPAGRAAVYHAWVTDVRRGASWALEADADGLLMPAMDADELLAVLFAALERAAAGRAAPSTAAEHEATLRARAPSSPFWALQGVAEGPDH